MAGGKILLAAGVLALQFASVAVAAQDKPLDCMAGQYSEEDLQQVDAYGPALANGGQLDQATLSGLGAIVMTAVGTCAESRGWSREATNLAAVYELGRLAEISYRAGGELSSGQLRMIDRSLATEDTNSLWAVIERGVIGGMDGEPDQVAEDDALTLGLFVERAGLISREQSDAEQLRLSEKVGVLFGFMGMQRVTRRQFATID